MKPTTLTQARTPTLTLTLTLTLTTGPNPNPNQERRAEAVRSAGAACGAASSVGGGRGDGAIGVESKAAVAEQDGCAVHELPTIKARLEFARAHGLSFDEGVQDTLEEDLDASGVPERYALAPPPGVKPYRRQKPGICYFPSDRDAVYVVSEGQFGSYECP